MTKRKMSKIMKQSRKSESAFDKHKVPAMIFLDLGGYTSKRGSCGKQWRNCAIPI
jgi:hypothetical protein